jgi:D-amino-acid dehydrogenase
MDEVVVIGGGIVGASAAYRLADRGARVTLVDRADDGQATAAGAGILSPGNRFPRGSDLLPLVRQATNFYRELLAGLADDGERHTGYEVVGAVHAAFTQEEVAALAAVAQVARERRAAGYHHVGEVTLLDDAEARALFPPLGATFGAVHLSGPARVDGRLLRDALHRAAARRGAALLDGHAELVVERGRAAGARVGGRLIGADAVVVAAGAWSAAVAARLGLPLPVFPQRGQIAHLLVDDADTDRWPIVVGFGSHYLLAFPGGRVVAGATREDTAGHHPRVTAAGVHEVLGEALRLAPGLAGATLCEVRVGLRPASPDGLPVLGPAPGVPNLFLATGHGPSGLQLGPWSGAAVADLTLGEPVDLDLDPFSAGRFQPAS